MSGVAGAEGDLRPDRHRCGPEDCFLALRGLRTMKLRLDEANRQGMAMADWLSRRPEVKTLLHPAFPFPPRPRDLEARLQGRFGPVLGDPQPVSEKALAAFLDGLQLFGWAIPGAATKASSCLSTARPTAA